MVETTVLEHSVFFVVPAGSVGLVAMALKVLDIDEVMSRVGSLDLPAVARDVGLFDLDIHLSYDADAVPLLIRKNLEGLADIFARAEQAGQALVLHNG